MKTKLILKGILLYITVITVITFVMALGSFFDAPMTMLVWLAIATALAGVCRRTVTLRELYILTGYNVLKKLCYK